MKYQFDNWEEIRHCYDCPCFSRNDYDSCNITDQMVHSVIKPRIGKPDWCPLVEVKEQIPSEEITAGSIRQSIDENVGQKDEKESL